MSNESVTDHDEISRRNFIKASAAAATTVGALTAGLPHVFAAGSDKIRAGLIGCGVRGTGVAMNCVLSSPGVEIVALGDVFPDQVDKALARLKDNTQPLVGEALIGTKGKAQAAKIQGANPWKYSGPDPNPYEQEHADLLKSIRDGKPLNEGRSVAEATLTAIMGRMSAYSGQPVSWEFAMKESELDLTPKEFKNESWRLGPAPKIPPPAKGNEPLV